MKSKKKSKKKSEKSKQIVSNLQAASKNVERFFYSLTSEMFSSGKLKELKVLATNFIKAKLKLS